MSRTTNTRELAARESDGLHVLLLWHPRENALTVEVEDARIGDGFHFAVAPERARLDHARIRARLRLGDGVASAPLPGVARPQITPFLVRCAEFQRDRGAPDSCP